MLFAGFYGVEKVQFLFRPLIIQLIGQSRRAFQLCLEGKTLLTERLKEKGKERSHPSGAGGRAETHTACCCISVALQEMCHHCQQEQQRNFWASVPVDIQKKGMDERKKWQKRQKAI